MSFQGFVEVARLEDVHHLLRSNIRRLSSLVSMIAAHDASRAEVLFRHAMQLQGYGYSKGLKKSWVLFGCLSHVV